ncbi:hypothetical protein SAMN06269185_3273 [Natronoarchaeum philippinense]|uniref:Uncharacterized protein n=1 Tax=Natronoarchaeum philippinense TaxID=558529 RepID=A0A285PAC1_NATPI|nr:hypothetical protein [Natronoarchaeum philippinense]SNZ18163.1 hypothetical protein SAMN06269185_3273 [Natronoarchaeum philippinense]
MADYRWVGAHAYRDHRNDRVIEPGEEIGDDAERIVAAHPHDVEQIDADDAGFESFEDGIETVRDAVSFDPAERTNDEIADLVEDIDNREELAAIRDLEQHEQNRSGALDAINDRLDELE